MDQEAQDSNRQAQQGKSPLQSTPSGSLHKAADEKSASRKRIFTVLALLTLGLLLYLPWLGSYGPLDPTDSFFIESGREIFETNQWLLPLQNYKPWLDKPILYFWLVAGSYKILGVNPLAGRLVSALSGICLGLITYFFSAPYLRNREAALAAIIFMAFPLSCAIGHVSLTDMPLTLFMATAQLALFHYEKSNKFSSCLIAYVALGLAFLCKGPISVIIVAAIYGLYWLLTCRSLKNIPGKILKARPFLGLSIMTAINLPWYTAATIGTNGAFFRDFFITQNFGRMTGTVNHQQPFWFYIPVVAGGLFPWSLFIFSLPGAVKKLWQKRKHLTVRQHFLFFNLTWAILVLVLFSIIKTKLPTYILPAMPPMAILLAATASYWSRSGRILPLLPSAALILATMLGAIYGSWKAHGWVGRFLTDVRPIIICALLAAIVYAVLLLRKKLKAAMIVLTAISVGATALLVPLAHIAFYKERQEPFEVLIARIAADDAAVATVIVEAPALSYFLHRHIPCLHDSAEAQQYMSTPGPHMLLVPREVLKDGLSWFTKTQELGKTPNGKWTLFKLD